MWKTLKKAKRKVGASRATLVLARAEKRGLAASLVGAREPTRPSWEALGLPLPPQGSPQGPSILALKTPSFSLILHLFSSPLILPHPSSSHHIHHLLPLKQRRNLKIIFLPSCEGFSLVFYKLWGNTLLPLLPFSSCWVLELNGVFFLWFVWDWSLEEVPSCIIMIWMKIERDLVISKLGVTVAPTHLGCSMLSLSPLSAGRVWFLLDL